MGLLSCVHVGMQPMQLLIFFLVEMQIIKVPCFVGFFFFKRKGRSLKPDTVKKFKFMIDSQCPLWVYVFTELY